MPLPPQSAASPAYRRLDERLRAGGVVVLDGGIGSELQAVGYPADPKQPAANHT